MFRRIENVLGTWAAEAAYGRQRPKQADVGRLHLVEGAPHLRGRCVDVALVMLVELIPGEDRIEPRAAGGAHLAHRKRPSDENEEHACRERACAALARREAKTVDRMDHGEKAEEDGEEAGVDEERRHES